MAGFRPNLVGKVPPDVERYIRALQDDIDQLRFQLEKVKSAQGTGTNSTGSGPSQPSDAGLIGALAQPLIGGFSSDQSLIGVSTQQGTVTSVGLSAAPASVFGVGGSPVTGSGTLALSMNSQAANKGLMGPTSGGAAAPAFRLLVAADLPTAALQSTNSKVTAAAPYTNDGYVIVTINGVSIKLMTTA